MWCLRLLFLVILGLTGSSISAYTQAHAQTPTTPTYYEILNVRTDATPAEIRAAAATQSTPEAKQAYLVLSDPELRRRYDAALNEFDYIPLSPEQGLRDPETLALTLREALTEEGYRYESIAHYFSRGQMVGFKTDLIDAFENRNWHRGNFTKWKVIGIWIPTVSAMVVSFVYDIPLTAGIIAGIGSLYPGLSEYQSNKNSGKALNEYYQGAETKFFALDSLSAESKLAVTLSAFDHFEDAVVSIFGTNAANRQVAIHSWLTRFAQKSEEFRLGWFLRALVRGELTQKKWRLTLQSNPGLWRKTLSEFDHAMSTIPALAIELPLHRYDYAQDVQYVRKLLKHTSTADVLIANTERVVKSRCEWLLVR